MQTMAPTWCCTYRRPKADTKDSSESATAPCQKGKRHPEAILTERVTSTFADAVHVALAPLPMECKLLVGRCLEQPVTVKASMGSFYMAFLRNDGDVDMAWGVNAPTPSEKTWCVPCLPHGVTYVDLAASSDHLLLMRSDGQVVKVGTGIKGFHYWRPARPDAKYLNGSAAVHGRGVLIRDDGQADVYCSGGYDPLPSLPPGVRYIATARHHEQRILLRSDGKFAFCGVVGHDVDVVTLPPLPEGVQYTKLAVGEGFMTCLRSDGRVHLWEIGGPLEPLMPDTPRDQNYVDIAAGAHHIALLHKDGRIDTVSVYASSLPSVSFVASIEDVRLPRPPVGMSYVHVSAFGASTLAVRSDGAVVYNGPEPFYFPVRSGLRLLAHGQS